MSAVVLVQNLRYAYPGRDPVLRNVSFHLLPGRILAVCGLGGQGKSTLLRLLMGLETPDAGLVKLLGRDISALSGPEFNALKRNIGFMFQNLALISNKTVRENVALPLVYHNVGNQKEICARVDSALEMLLIREFQHQHPAGLSPGIQKRVALARAIVMRPKLLLLDEPTAGLDNVNRAVLLALIENVRRVSGVSMILVTHDLPAARELNAGIGVLKDGELLEPMPFEQLKKCQDSFVERLFGLSSEKPAFSVGVAA